MQLLPTPCTKALGLGLFLLPLASSASAGDYVIRVTATVTTINTAPSAPFDGAVVGDTLIASMELFNVPTVVTPEYWTYDLDVAHAAMRIGTASALISTNTGPNTVSLASAPQGMGGDFLLVTGEVSAVSMETFVIAVFDSTGQLIPSQDIAQAAGTYPGPFPANTAKVILQEPLTMGQLLVADIQSLSIEALTTTVGTPFCDPAAVNSTGLSAQIEASVGTGLGADLHLEVSNGPTAEFGYFLVGTSITSPGITLGNGTLCMDSVDPLGRYNLSGSDRFSLGQFDAGGVMQNLGGTSTVGSGFDVPLTLPLPGSPSIVAGETWHFQAWYRDSNPTMTSNFSSTTAHLFVP